VKHILLSSSWLIRVNEYILLADPLWQFCQQAEPAGSDGERMEDEPLPEGYAEIHSTNTLTLQAAIEGCQQSGYTMTQRHCVVSACPQLVARVFVVAKQDADDKLSLMCALLYC